MMQDIYYRITLPPCTWYINYVLSVYSTADKKRRSVSPESRHTESPPPNSKSGPVTGAASKTAADMDTRAEKKDRFGKRNDSEAVMSARERYLARKAAKLAS